MTDENKCLIDAMMLLEIAFFDGGPHNWKNDLIFAGMSEVDMAGMAHALIQCANSGHKNTDYKKAKALVANISARMAIEDAKDSARNADGN